MSHRLCFYLKLSVQMQVLLVLPIPWVSTTSTLSQLWKDLVAFTLGRKTILLFKSYLPLTLFWIPLCKILLLIPLPVSLGFTALSHSYTKGSFWKLTVYHFFCRGVWPWICMGDFNELLWPHEKSGDKEWELNIHRYLREFIQAKTLVDIGFSGLKFTWEKNLGWFGQNQIVAGQSARKWLVVGELTFNDPHPRPCCWVWLLPYYSTFFSCFMYWP